MGKINIAHWLTTINRQSYISKVLSRYLHSLTDNTLLEQKWKKPQTWQIKSVLFFSVRDAAEEDSDLDGVFTLKTSEGGFKT